MTINYFDVFSRFHSKVEDYAMIDLSPTDVYSMERDWLRAAVSLPRVYRLFSSIESDDMIAQVECELKYTIDDIVDQNFVEEVLAIGMVIGWTSIRLRSSLNTSQMFGGKEEKFYSQAAHIAQLREMNHEAERDLSRVIRDRGYFNNSYLDGE
jgi:hypothetical protein